MPTTSNFGWNTPADTDLVKDGALAIRTLGNNIDSSLVDLKGGTTGQVLTKATNTDLDYTWTTPEVGDLTGIQAGTGISVASATGPVPVITNQVATAFDAKGDLVVGTGADTFAKLTTGSNGESLVADSTTTTGLRWQADWNVGKNKIINGDFRIAQRSTSFSSVATGTYTLDRWQSNYDGTAGTYTISQQSFTVGSAPVAGYESPFFLRYAVSTAGTGGSVRALDQRMEDVRTFAGQTITVSFWAKADTSRSVGVQVYQNFGSGGSGEVYTSGTSASVTTSWARYSTTISVPSISGKTLGASSFLGLRLTIPYGATATVDFWGVQVEAGSVATPFTTATGTLAGELAACQRYYWRNTGNNNGQATFSSIGWAFSTTQATIQVQHPVTMRVAPTAVDYAELITYRVDNGNQNAVTALTINNNSPLITEVISTSGSLAQYAITVLRGDGSGIAYLGFSAEL